MQTTGYLISAATKLSACVKNSKHHLYCRFIGLVINADRNTSSIINYGNRIIFFNCHINFCAITCQSLIDRVIHNLIYQMMKTTDRCTAYIHTRSFTNCFQSLQNLDLICSIFVIYFCSHNFPLFYKNFTFDFLYL